MGMRLKTSNEEKTESIGLRISLKNKNALKRKAQLYCDGNLTEWLVYAALNYVPSKKELEEKK